MKLLLNNSGVLELTGLRNQRTGVPIEDATVEATLYDANGDEVAGQVWPLTMDHEGSGNYVGVLSADLVLVPGERYNAKVIGQSAGAQGEWNLSVPAARRDEVL